LNNEAAIGYKIQGTIRSSKGHWTATVDSSLQTSNDQTNVTPNNWQLVHGLQAVTTDEKLVDGHGNLLLHRHSEDSYTLDAASSYMQSSDNSNAFFLPANVTQTLSEEHSVDGALFREPYHSSLYETIQGYAAMQENSGTNISNGATTAYANLEDSAGRNFHEVLEARGGVVTLKHITGW
jgi:hypothetical protein